MQPQGGVVNGSGGVSLAWQGVASVMSRSDIGAATKLAYWDLWSSLGAKPGCLDLTLHAWGAQLGRSARAVVKDWLPQLLKHGLVEIVAQDNGKVRLYVVAPWDIGKPRRFEGDPQRALPGLEDFDEDEAESQSDELPPAALVLNPALQIAADHGALAAGPARDGLVGPFGAQRSDSDLSAHKGPASDAEAIAGKRPSEMSEVEALAALLTLRRVEHTRGEPPAKAARLGGTPASAPTSDSDLCAHKGPTGAQRSASARRVQELRAQSSSIIKKPEELRALSSAQRSESDVGAHKGPTAKPQAASPIGRVLAQGSPEAVEAHQRRRSRMIEHVLGKIDSLKASVARNVVDGVLNKLFEWHDVERMIERAQAAQVPWQYFVGAAKQKYRDVRAPWPSGHRTSTRS
jgi:hypothetical protein